MFQYRQRCNTGNVPLLTYQTYNDYNNANVSIYGSYLLIGDHFVFFGHVGSCYMSNFVKYYTVIF